MSTDVNIKVIKSAGLPSKINTQNIEETQGQEEISRGIWTDTEWPRYYNPNKLLGYPIAVAQILGDTNGEITIKTRDGISSQIQFSLPANPGPTIGLIIPGREQFPWPAAAGSGTSTVVTTPNPLPPKPWPDGFSYTNEQWTQVYEINSVGGNLVFAFPAGGEKIIIVFGKRFKRIEISKCWYWNQFNIVINAGTVFGNWEEEIILDEKIETEVEEWKSFLISKNLVQEITTGQSFINWARETIWTENIYTEVSTIFGTPVNPGGIPIRIYWDTFDLAEPYEPFPIPVGMTSYGAIGAQNSFYGFYGGVVTPAVFSMIENWEEFKYENPYDGNFEYFRSKYLNDYPTPVNSLHECALLGTCSLTGPPENPASSGVTGWNIWRNQLAEWTLFPDYSSSTLLKNPRASYTWQKPDPSNQENFVSAWDWGRPDLCKAKLANLGFSLLEIG